MPLFGPPNIEKMQAKHDVNGLIKALGYKDDDIKCDAVKALGEIGDPSAVAPLVAMFQTTSRPIFRFEDIDIWTEIVVALGNLGDVGNPLVVETLVKAFKESEGAAQRNRVGGALVKFGMGALTPLIPDIEVYPIESLLVQIGTPAVNPLLLALKNPKASQRSLRAIAEALAKLNWTPDNSETGVIFYIYREEWDKCVLLGSLAVESLLAALERFNRHDHNQQRFQVIRTLGRIGAENASQPLITILNDKYESPEVRNEAAIALGKIGTEDSIKALIVSLQVNSGVQPVISQVLTEIGKPAAFEPLVKALQNDSEQVRVVAAKALANIGDSRAIEPLTECLLRGNCTEAFPEALDKCGWHPGSDEIGAAYWIAKDRSKVVHSFVGSGKLKEVKIICWEKCLEIGLPALGPLIRGIDVSSLSDQISSQLLNVVLETLLKIGDRDTILTTLLIEVGKGNRNAGKLLDQLGWQPDKSEIGAAYWVVKRKWNDCFEIGQPAILPLERALWHCDNKDCVAIIETLGKLGWRSERQNIQGRVEGLVDRLMEMKAYESLVIIGQPALPQINAQLARWIPTGSNIAVSNLSGDELTSLHRLENAVTEIGGSQAITALEHLSKYVAGILDSYLKLHRQSGESPTHLTYELDLIGRRIEKLRGKA